jgi:threonine/homoserine/homoserine lactone efflux protein
MFLLIQHAVGFGVAAGTTPGPLLTYLINETLLHGWRHSFYIIFTPLLTDAPIILLAVVILDRFPASVLDAISIVGGLFVLWMAVGAWKRSTEEVIIATDAETHRHFTIARGMMLNVLSPAPYIFWGTVLGPLLVEALEESMWQAVSFLAAFYGSFLCVMSAIALVFNRMRGLDERIVRGLLRFAALLLVFFGVSLLVQGIS